MTGSILLSQLRDPSVFSRRAVSDVVVKCYGRRLTGIERVCEMRVYRFNVVVMERVERLDERRVEKQPSPATNSLLVWDDWV